MIVAEGDEAGGAFSIERSHNTSGGDTGDAIYVYAGSTGNATAFTWTLPTMSGSIAPTKENHVWALSSIQAQSAYGNGFIFSPGNPWVGYLLPPSLCVAAVANSDFPAQGAMFDVIHYGQLQHWFATGTTAQFNGTNNTSNLTKIAIRMD